MQFIFIVRCRSGDRDVSLAGLHAQASHNVSVEFRDDASGRADFKEPQSLPAAIPEFFHRTSSQHFVG